MTPDKKPVPDWVEALREDDKIKAAREAARLKAIQGPSQRPRPRPTPQAAREDGTRKYLRQAFSSEVEEVAAAPKGTRNHRLFVGARNLAELLHGKAFGEADIKTALMGAAQRNGLLDDPDDGAETCRKTIDSGIRMGRDTPRDLSGVGTMAAPDPNVVEVDVIAGGQRQGRKSLSVNDIEDEPLREIGLQFLSTAKSRLPQWVWRTNDVGLVQLGHLVLFAGRPGAGKSTAARWLAAQVSNGTLPGAWEGNPMNVALFCGEEDVETAVITSLDAAGADRSRVATIFANDALLPGERAGILVLPDEERIIKQLQDNDIRCLIVDPIMETFSQGSDPNSQLDVRKHLSAYTRIAKAINGIVIGIAHLRKPSLQAGNRGNDGILSEITGSSAWGEVVRSAIAFATQGGGDPVRLMQVVKNSAGAVGAAWQYKLELCEVETDDGLPLETTRFDIIKPSPIGIDDLGGEDDADLFPTYCLWLRDYLEANGPTPSATVKAEARKEMSLSQLHRARKKLSVEVRNISKPEAPHATWWGLPGAYWS